jgi:putative hemolysin
MIELFYNLFIILCIIMVNAVFVIAEISLLTVRKAKLEKSVLQDKSRSAAVALKLASEPEKFLSSVQVGITLMSIMLGFYSGSTVADKLSEFLVPFIGEYSEQIGNFIVILGITYFTVLGEIIPKRIAMIYPEKMAKFIAYIMQTVIFLSYPVTVSLSLLTKLCLRLCGIRESASDMSISELKLVINQAEVVGALEKTERDMIRRLVHLSDIEVDAVMTPRTDLVILNVQDDISKNLEKMRQCRYSTFPLISDNYDNILGIVYAKDVLELYIQNKEIILQNLARKASYIPNTARLNGAINFFKQKNIHFALVTNEYGDIDGIITFNDILKTFVGDIVTKSEGQYSNIIKSSKGDYIVRGNVPIEEIIELLSLDYLPNSEDGDSKTLASFIINQLNRFPKPGDSFECVGWKFHIRKMQNFKIATVVISRISN